jgi:hypothetical protein
VVFLKGSDAIVLFPGGSVTLCGPLPAEFEQPELVHLPDG